MSRKLSHLYSCTLLIASVFFIVYPHLSTAEDIEIVRIKYKNDVEAVTKHFESMIPPEARNVDGTPMKDHPAYKKVKEQYGAAIKNIQEEYKIPNTERIQQHEKVLKELPPDIAKKLQNTGRDPASIHSDYDFSADFGAANAYAEKMKNLGNEVIQKGDRFIIKGRQDTTVWINKPAGSDPVGSSSFEAELAHKANVDSDAYLSVGDNTSKKVEILDHTRKFVHAKNSGDVRVQGKTLIKITKTAGAKPGDPGIIEQSNKLYNENATVEQAGIVDFGDPPEVKKQKIENWTKKAGNTITDIHRKVDAQSRQEYANLDNQIKQANEAGNTAKAAELKKAKIKNSLEVKNSIEAISESDPEFGGKLTGNEVKKVTKPDGSVIYVDGAGNTMSKSEFVSMTGKNVLKDLKSTYKSMLNPTEPVVSFIKTPTNIKAGAGSALTLLFLYETWREMKKEEKPWETSIETAGKTLIYATGIPGAIQIGNEGAKKALKEYDDCIKAGRQDCSKAMTVLKANLYAVNDANTAFWTGIADIPGFVINTPLRWEADQAEEIAKEMEKRIDEYRPVGAARKLAAELSRLADEADTQLRSFTPLDEQAWKLQREIVSVKSGQQQLNGFIDKLKNLCRIAKETNKQAAAVKNPAEMTANLTKRLAAIKQLAQQTCSAADQTIKAFNENRIDEKTLESYKANIKSKYFEEAEKQYSFAQQEMAAFKGPAKDPADFISQVQGAQKEYIEYMNFIQALSKDATKLEEEYVNKIVQLNKTVTSFNNSLAKFRTGVKYFYNERSPEEREQLLELAREVDKLKIDTKSAREYESKIKGFYSFAVDVIKLAQTKPEPCPEINRLLVMAQNKDPLGAAFGEAGQRLEEGRRCYANLKDTAPATVTVSIRVSPWGRDVSVGDTLTFNASVFPEITGSQYYFRWTLNNKETGNKGSTQPATIGRKGGHTVKVEAFRTVSGKGQKIGEALYSFTANEKERLFAKASMYISGPGKLKMGQSGTYTGMISETNVSESALYFIWSIDGRAAGNGKTISFTGNTAGSHTISAELWLKGNPDVRLGQAGYAVVVEGQPTPQKDYVAEEFNTCVKKAQDRFEGEMKEYNTWWNTAPDKRISWYICGSIGTNWQGPCPEDHSKRCEEREKCLGAGGGNQCFQYFQEVCYYSSLKQKRKSMDEAIAACEKKHNRQASAQIKNSFPLPNAPVQPKIAPATPKK
jgi:hypothetical protein